MRATTSVVALMDCNNLDIDRVPNMIASFNFMTQVWEQFANSWIRVLQESWEVLVMAISD